VIAWSVKLIDVASRATTDKHSESSEHRNRLVTKTVEIIK
jgi:hypothetical protein